MAVAIVATASSGSTAESRPDPERAKAAPLVQVKPAKGLRKLVEPDCALVASNGEAPSALSAAVSSTTIVVVTKTTLATYNKGTCKQTSSGPLRHFTITDAAVVSPRVIHDPVSDRFLLALISGNSASGEQWLSLFQSEDASAINFEGFFTILRNEDGQSVCDEYVANDWDGLTLGQSPDRWFIAADNSYDYVASSTILSFEKGTPMPGRDFQCFNDLAPNVVPPIVLDDPKTAVFIAPEALDGGNKILRYALNISANGPTGDTLSGLRSVRIPRWTAAPAVVQPNHQMLDAGDGRFSGASIQSGRFLWNIHTIAHRVTAKPRAYKLTVSGRRRQPVYTFMPTTVKKGHDDLFNASLAVIPGKKQDRLFFTATRSVRGHRGSVPSMVMLRGRHAFRRARAWSYVTVARSKAPVTGCQSQSDGTCAWSLSTATTIDPTDPTFAWGFNQIATGTPPLGETDWRVQTGRIAQ